MTEHSCRPSSADARVGDYADRAKRALTAANLRSLYARAWRLSRSHADAEDIVQELLCDFVGKIPDIAVGDEISWLNWNLGRYAASHYRRRMATPMEPSALEDRPGVVCGGDGPATVRAPLWFAPVPSDNDAINAVELNRAFGALDRIDAEIVYLRYYTGLSVDQTAEIVNLSPSNVSTRCSRACAQLRRLLSTDFN